MLSTRKPGPPVPPRPSAAAVASALARHRENSPSPVGVHTLKPPHPGRTVVYKSPGFDQPNKPQHISPNGSFNANGDSRICSGYSPKKTEVYLGDSNGLFVPRPILPVDNGTNHRNNETTSNLVNASTSASSSPMSTLQKPESIGYNERNHHNSADEEDTITSQKQLKKSHNHRHLDTLDDASAIRRNSSDVIVINSTTSEHDSGTEQNSIDTNSIASSNSLERENNLKNLESRQAHMTEIIIGSGPDQLCSTTTVVTNGTSTIIEARNDALLTSRSSPEPIKHVIRTSSIRLPYRPEPEGGEHISPTNDRNAPTKLINPPSIDPKTIDSKLSEKKVAFHELLISELTAMRQASGAQDGAATAANAASRRQRCPPETRSSADVSPNGTASRPARIRTADWIEVGDNGKEVVLSSCQISLEDSGLEDEEKLDDASSGVGDSWDSVKDAEERITMSLPGLPPLPKSLSGFDLAGQQLQAHQQHHLLQQQQHQQHHHQSSNHQQQHHLQPPQHQPPPPPSQQTLSQQQQLLPSLNHHPTNPFIPIGVNLQSVSMASLVSQHGQSPVSTVSSGNSIAATPNSGSSSGNGSSSVRKPTTLDTQLAILRREMYGLRQLDLSLLSQLWALNESIQEFRTMLQEQETLSPPSPTPSNSDVNSVSSDDDEDDSSNTQTVGAGLLTTQNLIESVAAASVLSSSQSSRMRAPPPPPPNRKAPSRPV
ncbi:uncharacterized protein LOC134213397 isoform X2 [Armigeres subalbatus]|uniref:uncharacterized protein LOC134213397 isoform X2 n=1 Tax=Armigeres subalbatus TaxID=124917 RepID=UPI002ED2BC91